MIVLIHELFLLMKFVVQMINRRRRMRKLIALQPGYEKPEWSSCMGDAHNNITFDPPVYKQRYGVVQQVLLNNDWKADIKKIVDFGCSHFGLFRFVKWLHRIQEVVAVDVDQEMLRENLHWIYPLTIDYLNRRTEPLTVRVLAGSISYPDVSLIGTDAVIAIELIEHLYPDTLDAIPYNIFGFIKPKVAIFTTPNADFNVLFPNFRGIRNDDHKFEWSREQFESWAINITSRFQKYSVTFSGIGCGPIGTEHLGCCSQMAVFVKERDCNCDAELSIQMEDAVERSASNIYPHNSFGVCTYHSCTIERFGPQYNNYKVVEVINYPFQKDDRLPEQKILEELKYRISLMGNINGRFYNQELNRLEIPLIELVFNQNSHYTTVFEAKDILEQAGYRVEQCLVCGDPEICVVYEPEMENHGTAPNSDTASVTSKTDWSALSVNGSELDWETDGTLWAPNVTSQMNGKALVNDWIEDVVQQDSEKEETLESVGGIVNALIDCTDLIASDEQCERAKKYNIATFSSKEDLKKCNIEQKKVHEHEGSTPASNILSSFQSKDENQLNEEEKEKGYVDSNCDPNNALYDSGYYKSNTNLTTSTQSSSDLLDGELDDQFATNTHLEKDKMSFISNHVVDDEKLNTESKVNNDVTNFKQTNCPNTVDKISFAIESPPPAVKNLKIMLESKESAVPNTSKKINHIKDNAKETLPGTSMGKKRKKLKRVESDDEDDSSANSNASEDVKKKEVDEDEEEKYNGVILPEPLEMLQILEPIVENGDLANNNRDLEGNNYPDAQIDEPNIYQNDNAFNNEHLVLQNNVDVEGEDQRNEDVKNRNAEVDEEEANDVEIAQDLQPVDAVEVVPEEIEFPSREALFDPNSEIDLLEDLDISNPAREISSSVIIIGVNVEPQRSEDGSVLPPNADPFPNWLLRLLGNGIVEDGDTHDEPHFYCQGDGLGVHPSFIEEDFEDQSSSDSDSETSTETGNDNAEAEATVSEAVSLQEDPNEVVRIESIAPVMTAEQSLTAGAQNDVSANSSIAGTSNGADSADEFFDTIESLSMNSNRTEKSQVENTN